MRWVVFLLVLYAGGYTVFYYLLGWLDQRRARKEFERIIEDCDQTAREPGERL